MVASSKPLVAGRAEPGRRGLFGHVQVAPHRFVLFLKEGVEFGLQSRNFALGLFVVHPVFDLLYPMVQVAYPLFLDVAYLVGQRQCRYMLVI